MPDDAERAADALSRLRPESQRLVGACLRAAVQGPYLDDDDEFHTLMGVTREEAAEVAESWPQAATNGLTFLTVNNALNNLLGYPHGQWRQLARDVHGDEEAVAQALMAWRDEEHRDGSGKGYFDALM
jgi:hypothetical protein